jgi:uncharacterized protein YunC (DUF1805 family)
MICEKIALTNKHAEGFVVPLGSLNLVGVVTDVGMVGCGAFDVTALDGFNYPAARVRSGKGGAIATIEDLLSGIVKDANVEAVKRGVRVGMTGREALELM